MKTVCLYFQVHQPWRLKKYRFFNMGKDHNYLDDLLNRSIMQKVARQCYLPMNALLLKLIQFFYILIVTLSPCIHGFHDFGILFVKFVRDPDRFLSRFHITMLSGKHDDQFVAALLQSMPEWDRICDSSIQIIMPSDFDRLK